MCEGSNKLLLSLGAVQPTCRTSLLLSWIWREHAKQEEFQCFCFRNFIANLISSSNVGDMRNRFIVTILLHQNKLTSNATFFRLSNQYLSTACTGALIFWYLAKVVHTSTCRFSTRACRFWMHTARDSTASKRRGHRRSTEAIEYFRIAICATSITFV